MTVFRPLSRWRNLPEHFRRGLKRLYLVVAVPWVAWYSYQMYDALRGHYTWYWRYASHAFWSMLMVPIGGPILVLVGVWVLAGFKKASPSTAQAPLAPNDGGSSSKPPPDFFGAGKTLGEIFVKPNVWRTTEGLRDYKAPDSVARHEIAFARVAIVKETIKRRQPETIATKMLAGVDQYVAEAFANEEDAEVLKHYGNRPLSVIAPEAIQLYENNLPPLFKLATVLARRLSVTSLTPAKIAVQFEEVAAEAEQLMKVSSSLQRLNP